MSRLRKKLKAAPFQHTRIDVTAFSPDGKLLAIVDHNSLVLWRWQEDAHERVELGRSVGSLTFSPDGKFLAEGPSPRENIRIRDLETRKVMQTLTNDPKRSMVVPSMAYTQGGRVLIGCNNILLAKEIAVPHRIALWDAETGAIAHSVSLPSGRPSHLDVTPNGRYLLAVIDDGEARTARSVACETHAVRRSLHAAECIADHRAALSREQEDRVVHLGRAGDHVLEVIGVPGTIDVGEGLVVEIADRGCPHGGRRLRYGRCRGSSPRTADCWASAIPRG